KVIDRVECSAVLRDPPGSSHDIARRATALQHGTAFGPARGGPLGIGVDDDRAAPRQGRLCRQVGRDRGLADTALGTGHQHCLHAPPPPGNVPRAYTGGVAVATTRPRYLGDPSTLLTQPL